MLKRKISVFAAAFFAAAALVMAQESKPEKTFMWEVSSDSATIYLLGSAHMAAADLYPLDQAITSAYEDSDVVVVEADVRPEKQMALQSQIMQKAIYSDGTGLKDHISAELYEKLADYLKGTPLDISQAGMMRPWILALTIAALELRKHGLDEESGIDMYFIKRAIKDEKELKELESIQYQIDLLSGFPEDLQEKFLTKTLNEAASAADQFKQLMEAWEAGDPAAMEKIVMAELKKSPELKPVFDKIIFERNVAMAAKVEEYLKTGKTHFVVVGAAHLVGDKGIVKLLSGAEEDYDVEQVDAEGRPVEEESEAEEAEAEEEAAPVK